MELATGRLRLRHWRDDDREPFAALNADPVVMEHFPAPLTRAESDAFVDRIEARFAADGWGLWAAERRDTGAFIGFIGLNVPGFSAPFLPGVEVGWRLAQEHWGQGFAPEGATEVLRVAFEALRRDEVLSFTAVGNDKSRRVMEKIGLVHHPDEDFVHPNLPPDHPIAPHVLYRITRARWDEQQAARPS
jgi:RimJ/RimL family protein N-acetyltransferase